jgi:subtilase family serine protease
MLQRQWARPVGCRLIPIFLCLWTLGLNAQVRSRIAGPVDERALIRLSGTVHPLAAEAADLGRVAAELPMERALLHLTPSAAQEAALEELLAAQQDPGAAEYHQWLTPEQFGERFGVSDDDLAAIRSWLEGQGLRVTAVSPGRRTIEFGGPAGKLEQAFHTEIHEFQVAGERHIGNATEISIPRALAPVVAGVISLNNFPRRPQHRAPRPAPRAVPSSGIYFPRTDLNGGPHGLSPYDFAAIYDVAGLWNNNFDGSGQTIGIAGRTNLKLSDVASFRSQFGLPAKAPQVIVNGADPGIISSDEETEADLDVEWSGAVAKGATVAFVVSASTNTTDGIDLSTQYLVDNNIASVISVSFGSCEASMGTAGNAFYNSLWQQAAAQGISVFVSAGDSGSAGCDAPSSAPASHGFAVSGLASTPYNVAVGGTEFSDASASNYWNSSNNAQEASAKGYIPEVVWNESSYTSAGASGNGLWAGSGGVSTVYATPTWQTGTGVPTTDPGASAHHRYMPDVSLSAAGHDGYLVVQEGGLYLVGGTSASSPSFAGILAMIDQYSGGRNGNPNAKFYPLAASAPSVYHDVTAGTNAVPCKGGSPNCSAAKPAVGKLNGYAAGAGYDLATGWGSVDAYELALNWGSGTVAAGPAITSLSPNPMTGAAAVQTLTIVGSGFTSGSGLKVTLTGGSTATYQGGQILSVSATQIQVSVSVGTAAQSFTVAVVNPNGKASNGSLLQVVAPAPPPAITSLSPNPMTGSSANQTLTINGTGLGSGTGWKVVLTTGGTTLTVGPSQLSSTGTTQMQATVNVGTAAETWSVQVVNPGGTASNSVNLPVVAPAAKPAITSLSPNPMTGSSASQTLTVNGTALGSGTGWKVVLTAGATTLTVQGSQFSSTGTTQIQAQVSVGTVAQTWSVQVVNPGGTASNSMSLPVLAPTPSPAITSVSPNPMTGASASQTLTIVGTGLGSGTGWKLVLTAGATTLTVPGSQLSATGTTQIQAQVNVGTVAQTWSVQVVNPGGTASNSMSLAVVAPVTGPSISSLTPNPMNRSNSAQTLTINGSGFQSGNGLVVKLTAGGVLINVQGSAIKSVSSSQITLQVNVGASARTYSVTVQNPGGAVSNAVNLTVH